MGGIEEDDDVPGELVQDDTLSTHTHTHTHVHTHVHTDLVENFDEASKAEN